MFGTGEKFDLTHAVYAREGSAFYLIENYYSHLLQLSTYKPGTWLGQNDFLFQLRLLTGHQDGRFPVGDSLAQGCLFQNGQHPLALGTLPSGLLEALQHLLVVDEFIGMGRLGVIHGFRISNSHFQ